MCRVNAGRVATYRQRLDDSFWPRTSGLRSNGPVFRRKAHTMRAKVMAGSSMSDEPQRKPIQVEIIGGDAAAARMRETVRALTNGIVGESLAKAMHGQITSINSAALAALNESFRIRVDLSKIIAESITARTGEIFRVLKPSFERFRQVWEEALPPNWGGLSAVDGVSRILEFMDETGWALAWVPRSEVITELLAAEDEKRAVVLLASETEILGDLVACLSEISDPSLHESRDSAAEAVECYRDGKPRGAQALATNLFSTLIHENLEQPSFAKARAEFTRDDPMHVNIGRFRLVAILRTAGRAIDVYRGEPDEPVPTVFNRHASTHQVGAVQYTRLNALTSLMLVVSVIRELDFWAERADDLE
jgi:hypothetical protein